MESILEKMISKYNTTNVLSKINAIKEVIQEVVLSSLSRTDFFDKAAFYGGTALRIFYNLNRFSEDLDFTLINKDDDFSLNKYFSIIEKEVNSLGLDFKIESKIKHKESNIQTAYLKGNQIEHLLIFYPSNPNITFINPDQVIKIKLEIDINPPKFANFETKYRLDPFPYEICLYDLPTLFSSKIAALLCRSWKNRIKGRDLYDFLYYTKLNTPFNLKHLESRLIYNSVIKENSNLTLENVKKLLNDKFDSINYEDAKKDVVNFIQDEKELKGIEIWSKNLFKYFTKELKAK